MRKTYTRIPLDVEPDFANEIDQVLAELLMKKQIRQTRTAFIREAIREKLDRLKADLSATAPRSEQRGKRQT
jgi:hypothetical protein